MKTYRYTLEPYKGTGSRYTCPQCGQKKVFVRYIDTQTGQHLAEDTGRCNRQEKCGYHKKPLWENEQPQYLNAKRGNATSKPQSHRQTTPSAPPQASSFSPSIFRQSLCNYQHNYLMQYVYNTMGYEAMERMIDTYAIGTQGNGTVFWQIDAQGHIRGGKVMAYDATTGKRIKGTQHAVGWMHSLHKYEGYKLQQCLFGEHLLHGSTLPVAIAESEKTAMIASIKMPQYLWLATGGINNLTADKCALLQGRRVVLFPDAGAYDAWLEKSRHIQQCSVSTLLEHLKDGSDIADWVV